MVTTTNPELSRILRKPSAAFSDPCEVLCQRRLTFDDKISVLKQWRRELLRSCGGVGPAAEDADALTATVEKIDECLRQLYV